MVFIGVGRNGKRIGKINGRCHNGRVLLVPTAIFRFNHLGARHRGIACVIAENTLHLNARFGQNTFDIRGDSTASSNKEDRLCTQAINFLERLRRHCRSICKQNGSIIGTCKTRSTHGILVVVIARKNDVFASLGKGRLGTAHGGIDRCTTCNTLDGARRFRRARSARCTRCSFA